MVLSTFFLLSTNNNHTTTTTTSVTIVDYKYLNWLTVEQRMHIDLLMINSSINEHELHRQIWHYYQQIVDVHRKRNVTRRLLAGCWSFVRTITSADTFAQFQRLHIDDKYKYFKQLVNSRQSKRIVVDEMRASCERLIDAEMMRRKKIY